MAVVQAVLFDLDDTLVDHQHAAVAAEKLATFGLAPYVDALVTSEEVGTAKPGPANFAHALMRCDCPAAGAVMRRYPR